VPAIGPAETKSVGMLIRSADIAAMHHDKSPGHVSTLATD
jgi:hypothetical protein